MLMRFDGIIFYFKGLIWLRLGLRGLLKCTSRLKDVSSKKDILFQASLSREYERPDNMKIEIDERKEQTSSKLLSAQLSGARPDRQQLARHELHNA